MKKHGLLIFAIIFAMGMSSCTKTEEVFEDEGSINERSFTERSQTEKHSLYLKSKENGVVKWTVLNDIMTNQYNRGFTIETVFSIDDYYYGDYRYILHQYNDNAHQGISLYLKENLLVFQYNTSTFVVYEEIERERCYHVSIAKKNEGGFFIYINGELVYEIGDLGFSSPQNSLFIGSRNFNSNSGEEPGITIDEIRFWKEYKERDFINHFLFMNIDENMSGLVTYFNFNHNPSDMVENFVSTAYDDGYLIHGAGQDSFVSEQCVAFYEYN